VTEEELDRATERDEKTRRTRRTKDEKQKDRDKVRGKEAKEEK